MSKSSKQLAIMKSVGIGMRDCYSPVLWFESMIEEGAGALQVLSWDEAEEWIKAYHAYDAHDLEGKPCWVSVEQNQILRIGPCVLK